MNRTRNVPLPCFIAEYSVRHSRRRVAQNTGRWLEATTVAGTDGFIESTGVTDYVKGTVLI